MYKCETCGFECMSKKLLDMHKQREEAGLTELEEKQKIRTQQIQYAKEYLATK
jgi:hypothetical protein